MKNLTKLVTMAVLLVSFNVLADQSKTECSAMSDNARNKPKVIKAEEKQTKQVKSSKSI